MMKKEEDEEARNKMAGGREAEAAQQSPSNAQQGFVLCVYSVSVILATLLIILFVSGRSSLTASPAPKLALNNGTDLRCPDLLLHLAQTVNESIDPCKDIYE